LASKASDRLLLGVVVTLAAAEVVTTLVFLDRLRMDPRLVLGATVGGVLVVRTLWAAHRSRVAGTERPPIRAAEATATSGAVRSTPVSVPDSRPAIPPAAARPGARHQGARPMPATTDDQTVLVGGVTSRSGHVNHPQARYCHRTGQRLEGRVGPPTTGPRPTLGVLCTDDGASHPLVVDLVVGRDPQRHHLVTDGGAEPLELDDATGALSRAHLLVTLRGWDIRVADLGSSNGTWLRTAEGETWERLAVGEAVTVPSGSVLACGDRRLRIDHLHVR
jgi:hypothetical protein